MSVQYCVNNKIGWSSLPSLFSC